MEDLTAMQAFSQTVQLISDDECWVSSNNSTGVAGDVVFSMHDDRLDMTIENDGERIQHSYRVTPWEQ